MQDKTKEFGNVLIVGLGMIGGSFAKSLKQQGLATLFGADRRDGELTLGVSAGVIDHPAKLDEQTLSQIDIIILATPVRAMASVLSEIKPYWRPDMLITDVGSTKGSVVEAAAQVFGEVPANFIPGHPIAGAEKSGVLAANPHLFEKHMAIVTPLPDSDPEQLDRLHRLWRAVGADVVSMDVDHHDHVLAASSHLPHLLAYTLVDALANADRSQDIFRFAAGGFRDFTRIASSDPVMWRDVFLANKEATLSTLDLFTERLADMRQAIVDADGASMYGVFTRAKSARDHFLRLLEQRTLGKPQAKQVAIQVSPASAIQGEISLLGDKSLSHRALIMAALSEGVSELANIDLAGDVKVTLQALRDMGVVIEEFAPGYVRVHGVGRQGLRAPIAPINVHNSATSLYLLLPVLAGQAFPVEVIGEEALTNTPFTQLLALLSAAGANVTSAPADCLPFKVQPSAIQPLTQTLPGQPSARLVSAAILLSLFSGGVSRFTSEETLDAPMAALFNCFGVSLDTDAKSGELKVESGCLKGASLTLPADAQQVVWVALLATLLPGSNVKLTGVAPEGRLAALFAVLEGAGMKLHWSESVESVFAARSLTVSFAKLQAWSLDTQQVRLLRGFLPLLTAAAVYAEGTSQFEGIAHLPYFYEDRITTLIDGVNHVGGACEWHAGTLFVQGRTPEGGDLDSAGNDLVALAFLLLSSRCRSGATVRDCQNLLEQIPNLEEIAAQLGLKGSVDG
ncbi:prephenate dehydrogenase/arogenate dehydrogenase family protein [Marinomonas ostreistagni]|uniref:prephenate dehydrogenase/arogenate dehydrogenase family protein n=1 Tax=Marinomonas ostreistagni TaxID=359209 RepID=UPI0019513C0B|nr:prephenate dehydrogenase/arogenate dehydrogenase family protein [Marinomonas ostreistagni]MBM6550478.1 prephenate dehydrogenase/arogenate dehydrogenase family protein [Marinomonas ostreistagni]